MCLKVSCNEIYATLSSVLYVWYLYVIEEQTAAVFFKQRNFSQVLLNLPEIRLYLPFSD